MPATGFHSEWITIQDHRILLESRAGFPDDIMKFIAQVSVMTCNNNSEENKARVVYIFYDDKSGCYSIKIASTEKEDKKIEIILSNILESIFNHISINVEILVFPEGDIHSDHYNHMEYLSIISDIASDRFKHNDEEYQKKVYSPR